MKPATEKQRNYAKCIAAVLGLRLPAEDSVAAYSAFISAHVDLYEDVCHDWPNDGDWECIDVPNFS